MACVKRCKHQAIRINARLPWNELLISKKGDFPGAFFAVFLTALVLAMKLPSWEPFSSFVMRHYTGDLQIADVAMAMTTGLSFTAVILFTSGFPSNISWKENFSIFGYAYLFLGFAGFFNIYFHEFVYSGHNLAPWTLEQVGLSSDIPAAWITPELGTLKALIPFITLMGTIFSLVMLDKLSEKHAIPLFIRRRHQGILLVTSVFFLAIL